METITLSGIRDLALELMYPSYCAGCGAPGAVACEDCLGGLSPLRGQGRYTLPWRGPTAFTGWRSGCSYAGLGKEMVLRLKSSERPFARPLAGLMLTAAGNDPRFLAPDVITWVPSEKRKTADRGYNPAELLARSFARLTGRPLRALLRKDGTTPDQASVGRLERYRNVSGCFSAAGALVPARVLLVDDVLTTGATADSCARVLLAEGAQTVHILVAARTLPQDVVSARPPEG